MDCPCQSGDLYDQCCGRFISHQQSAENALQLMRSRYTAFVKNQRDYIIQTWRADACPVDLQLDDTIRWVRLEIINWQERGEAATVEFEAWLLVDGTLQSLHERSEFVCQQGRWLYAGGKLLPSSQKPRKPARNEDCPCGSGVKYKRCCGR